MKVTWLLLLLFTLLAVSNSNAISAPSTAIELPNEISDVAGAVLTNVSKVAATTDLPWAVVTIIPDPFSGVGCVVKDSSKKTGYTVTCSVFGTYVVTSKIGDGVAAAEGNFAWPMPVFAANGDPGMDSCLPFTAASAPTCLVCQLNPKSTARDEFIEPQRVPPAWTASLPLAVAVLRKAASPFDPSLNRRLLNNPNPYLVLTECELLEKVGELSPHDISVALNTKDSLLRATVIALCQSYHWAEKPENLQWLLQYVDGTETMRGLESVGAGICAGRIVAGEPGSDRSVWAFYITYDAQVMSEVRRRLNELEPGGSSADPQWNLIDTECRYNLQ